MYIDQLDDIVNKYSNTYYRSIEMKPFDVKSTIYIDSSTEINDKGPKFQICNIVIMSKYTLQIGLKKILWVKELKILWRGHMLLLMISTRKKLLELFRKKNSKNKLKRV